MKRILSSQRGFTITEIMVVIAISGFLMAVAATGFSTFFAKFNEMSKVSELQRGAFSCLMTIKNGIPIGTGSNIKWSGVNSATSVTFVGTTGMATSSNSILLQPGATNQEHVNDYVKFFYDGKYVRATYLDGVLMPSSPQYLFPKPSRNNDIVVTKLLFTKADTSLETKVLKVDLEARVTLKKGVYRYVKYSTRMALSI